jgi:hypothetical protein
MNLLEDNKTILQEVTICERPSVLNQKSAVFLKKNGSWTCFLRVIIAQRVSRKEAPVIKKQQKKAEDVQNSVLFPINQLMKV